MTAGSNRIVLTIGRWAIKLPLPSSARSFAYGILNNLNEAEWCREHPGYCPVLYRLPFGLAIVMPRAAILTDAEFAESNLPALPGVERKASSWGRLGERVVAVDYGWRAA